MVRMQEGLDRRQRVAPAWQRSATAEHHGLDAATPPNRERASTVGKLVPFGANASAPPIIRAITPHAMKSAAKARP